jgi:hypothetical protein
VSMPIHAIRLVRIGVVSTWAAFSIHHAYEAGLAHSNGPIVIVVISTVILLATLALLERYERTDSQSVYALFSVLTLLWWVGANGLVEGFYGHTLKDLLYFLFRVAPAALPRTPLGLTYDVPTNLFGEVTGVLPFVFAILVAVAWFRLEVQRRAEAAARRGQQANAGG